MRAARTITRIISEPTTAEANRQPNGSMPNIASPAPISHFPTSGWTTMLGSLVQRSGPLWPDRILSLASEM